MGRSHYLGKILAFQDEVGQLDSFVFVATSTGITIYKRQEMGKRSSAFRREGVPRIREEREK